MDNKSNLGFRVLDDRQRADIHGAVLETLQRVGVEVHSERALDVARRAGAQVEGNRVKFPPALVEKSIRSAPSRLVLCDRHGVRRITLQAGRFHFGAGPTAIYTIDPVTGERRIPGVDDTRRASRVMDALPNIDFQMDFGSIGDVDASVMDVHAFEAMLTTSSKPIVHWAYTTRNCQAMIDMAAEVAGSLDELRTSPTFAIYSEPVSPLMHEADALDVAMLMAENGLPSIYTPAPLGGATAPATLAGIIVISLCESLSGLVLHQAVREGAPFIMGGVITILDMSATQITYGSPESMLMAAGLAEMARHYGIPSWSTAGCSDAKACDGQHAAEIAQNLLTAAMSGGNLIHDCGYMESGNCTSLQSLVIADELIGQVKRIVRGIEVDEGSLALDVIAAVGPGGDYMRQRHTKRHYRDEWFFPTILNRRRHLDWQNAGRPDLAANAQVKLLGILADHHPEPLDADVQHRVHAVLDRLG